MPDPDETERLYEALPTSELLALRKAFELDRRDATDKETIRFCDGRLAVINCILQIRSLDGNSDGAK